MTIEDQAEVALAEWLVWVVKEGGQYWLWGDIPDEAMAEWIPGYLRGVQDRLAAIHEYTDHETLWGYAEDLSLFTRSIPPDEMPSKCFAAGYLAGFRSIGGSHDNSNE